MAHELQKTKILLPCELSRRVTSGMTWKRRPANFATLLVAGSCQGWILDLATLLFCRVLFASQSCCAPCFVSSCQFVNCHVPCFDSAVQLRGEVMRLRDLNAANPPDPKRVELVRLRADITRSESSNRA